MPDRTPPAEEYEPSVAMLKTAVLDFLSMAKQALGQVDDERRRADAERNPLIRHYTQGLVDGMEEATNRYLVPFYGLLAESERPAVSAPGGTT